MEKIPFDDGSRRKIEKFLLCIYTIYAVYMIAASVRRGWDAWVGYFLAVGVFVNWIVCVSKCKDYLFRAKLSAVTMQISVTIFALYSDGVSLVLPVLASFVVFLGLYGICNIIWYSVISTVIIFFVHGVMLRDISFATTDEVLLVLSQFGNLILLEYVMYVWVRRNSDGSARLIRAIEELKEVENRKDDFLANVSHEIRTPINTICGISEIILQEELSQKVKDDVTGIQIAGRNLMTAVSDVLDFSELQSGNIEIEEEVYNITSTINDVISMAEARKNDKKLELIVDCDATLPCVLLGDEKKIRRVIMNLVDNAIKFTDSGFVSISIGYRRESYGINLSVTVKDSGIGMDAEGLEKLFVRFNQVDTSRKRQEGGLGLGLAISHALVKKMGGAITVKSRPGKGSVLKFVVPQKVVDDTPIATIDAKADVNVAVYIDMEQFGMVAIRDEYSNSIIHMVEQLKGKCHICRNFAELQRRESIDMFTHVFISTVEYRQEKAYFDELADRTKVIVVLDRFDEKYVTNPEIIKIIKPFYIQSVVAVLNGLYDKAYKMPVVKSEKFVTENVHVLVVDDNKMNIRVIEGLLANYNIKVTVAMSGHEALEKVKIVDYDFIFMDHMMPEMDGVEALHRIRGIAGSYYRNVPIIALTANAVAGTREMLIKEGFSDFLEKPIERSVLERVLIRQIAPEKIVTKDKTDSEEENEKQVESYSNLSEQEKELATLGIDVEKGILFCNGKDNYFSILKGFCEDSDEIGNLAKEAFENRDWKNYTIAVHGIKGAMRSIGAGNVSECAAQLEKAGKEGRTEYIVRNHNDLLEAYEGLFDKLRKLEWLGVTGNEKEEPKNDTEELPVIEEAAFRQIIEGMEEAMYSLDENRLSAYVAELRRYQYCDVALSSIMEPVSRKIEMSDYISAVEAVSKIKSRIENGVR